MLTLVEARNNQGDLLNFPLDDISDGIILASIEGLDPVKATLISSNYAQQDGAQFHSARRETRNILIKLGLEPDYIVTSVRDLRSLLYNFFMPKTEVELRFIMSESPTVSITGRVESCETPLFTSTPQVDISMICFHPDFTELTPNVLSGNSTDDTTETLIEYVGTVETGMELVFSIDRTLTEFTFYHRLPNGQINTLDFAGALEAGDVLTINTNTGLKGAILTRSSVNTSVLYGVTPQSTWHELERGDNYIRIFAEGADIPYTITYTTEYGGL